MKKSIPSAATLALHVAHVAADALRPVAQHFEQAAGLPAFSFQLAGDTAAVCNSTTPGTAGFLQTDDGATSTFFWLHESKNDPATDPLILWMSGGPGASSIGFGGFMELGPCRIAAQDGRLHTVDNPSGWNAQANLLIVDQPAGVGFSRAEQQPNGLADSSRLMDNFLRQFFRGFPQLADRDFYIAGESYGGSWVPALASQILRSQEKTETFAGIRHVQQMMKPVSETPPAINLKGIMIGNGLVRQSVQNPAGIEEVCGGARALFDGDRCREFALLALWCEQNLPVCETQGWLASECLAAQDKCTGLTDVVLGELHRNPYDWRKRCLGDPSGCYEEIDYVTDYLNSSDFKRLLGVPEDMTFNGISMEVFDKWQAVGDLWKASNGYVEELLEKGIRVLVYVGDKDWFCHAAGMRRLVDEGLTWAGKPLFRFRKLAPWYSGVKEAGRYKALEPLSYAEVAEAGHLVPFDQPEAGLKLINSWISGRLGAQ